MKNKKRKWVKRTVWGIVIALAGTGIAASLKPQPLSVETATVVRGSLVVTVDGTGKVRMVDRFTVSSPYMGELQRITLKAGDKVESGSVIARILPSVSQPLDLRSRNEMEARLKAAKAALLEAEQNVERVNISCEFAKNEADRLKKLVDTQAAPARSAELAASEFESRKAELALAKTTVERSRREVEAVKAQLGIPSKVPQSGQEGTALEILAPSAGIVLSVLEDSAKTVQPGTPLMVIGKPDVLELVVDLPTQEAVRVEPGAEAFIDGIAGIKQLRGKVRLVEPAAFTKISALGVEEQRVNVVIDPEGDESTWLRMGDGFAADAHVVVGNVADTVLVPGAAVFKNDEGYAVFSVEKNKAFLKKVDIGQRNAQSAEVLLGLKVGDLVVIHPSDKLSDKSLIISE